MNLPLDAWRLLASLWKSLASPIDPTVVIAAVSAFGFFSGFLTYVLTSIVARRAYIRIQRQVTAVIVAQGVSIFIGIMDLVTHAEIMGWQNFLFKWALIIWAVSLFPLYFLIHLVISVDRIKFKKPAKQIRFKASVHWKSVSQAPPFKSFQMIDDKGEIKSIKEFGVGCIDHCLREATKRKVRLYFPILLVAEKHFRPWRLCHRFAAAGLKDDESVICFGFNQPPDIIVQQLDRQFAFLKGSDFPDKIARLYIIDCYSSWIGTRSSRVPDESVKDLLPLVLKNSFRSDPRDVIALGSCYRKALRKAIRDGAEYVRVVYDSISDFLQYSDPQLAMQFIKHNMVWEDQNRANSLYLYIPDVPGPTTSNPVDINFLRWNAYCEIHLEYEKAGRERMFVEALFSTRKERYISMQEKDNDYVLSGLE